MQKYDDTPFRKSAATTARRVWRVLSVVSFAACVVQSFRFVDNLAYIHSVEGKSAMCSAATSNNFPAMANLHRRGVSLDTPCWRDREPLLGIAAMSGSAGMVEYLLAAGANPNTPNRQGRTPLSRARAGLAHLQASPDDYNFSRELRYIRIVRLLEEAGAVSRP